MLKTIIERAIAEAGLTNFTITHKVAKITDFPLLLAKDIVIVHSLNICISRTQAQDQSLNTLLTLESPERTVIYDRNIFKVNEIDTNGIQFNSELISQHQTKLELIKLPALTIYSGHVMYYQIHNKNA
jgi:hypothetical protein